MKKELILLAVLALAAGSGGCGHIKPGNAAQRPPSLQGLTILEARISSEPIARELTGTVKAGIMADVAPELFGEIIEIRVKEGDAVKKDGVLAVLDGEKVAAQVGRARAARSQAAAQARLANSTYSRFKELKRRGSVSDQEYDEVLARHGQASAGLREAEAALAAALEMEKDAIITSPVDGVVTAKLADVGDVASPGVPLFAVETEGGYRVDFTAPEKLLGSIKKGMKVKVISDSPPGTLDGVVSAVSPSTDPRSRSFLSKADLPEDARVVSGSFVRVMVPLGDERGISVPQSALVRRGQLTGIYIADKDGIARWRILRTGRDLGENVEIVSGLEEGTRYVAEPPLTLSDGVKIGG